MSVVIVILLVVIGVSVLIGLMIAGMYNGLVRLNERVSEAWSDIAIQLKYRADLIPNLVETVKAYAKHESEVFANVSKARSRLLESGNNVKDVSVAQSDLSNALGRLMMLTENYPELKADRGFAELQRQLQEIEDKIQGARRFYNGGARDLNTKIKTFPTNMIAKKLGFEVRDYFEVEDRKTLEDAPSVKF